MTNKMRNVKPKMGYKIDRNGKVKRKSHFKQGYYDVRLSNKYYGPKPVIYRSGLEFKFMVWCERNPNIVTWTSEPSPIPYTCPETGKTRQYYIDFIIEFSNGQKCLIEVKPYSQFKDAEVFSRIATRLGKLPKIRRSNAAAAKNDAKWKHAKRHAEKHNMKFTIITERFKFS